MPERILPRLGRDFKGQVGSRLQRRQQHAPVPIGGGHGRLFLLSQPDRHRFSGIGYPVDVNRNPALQDHPVGVERRQLQTSVHACNLLIDRLS